MDKNYSKNIGKQMEQLACQHLQSQGLKLITQNFHSKFGEIDLIMEDNTILVFIEVRYRYNTKRGHSLETVTTIKQRRLIKTAEYYLYTHPQLYNRASRFDVAAISPGDKNTDRMTIQWLKNAFTT